MNKLCILTTLAFPLTCAAQAPRAAIVIEEEQREPTEISTIESEDDSELFTDADTPADEIPAEALEELLQEDEPDGESDEQLPQQPDDIQPETSSEPAVVVKTEPKVQIVLADNQDSGFQLLSPWAPKPMQKAPTGWRYAPGAANKSYPLDVKLSSGQSLSLKVVPYALVPIESKFVVQACEPGYQPARGYQQTNSVSARLEKTTQTLELAADSLNESIQNLSALVDSLPK